MRLKTRCIIGPDLVDQPMRLCCFEEGRRQGQHMGAALPQCDLKTPASRSRVSVMRNEGSHRHSRARTIQTKSEPERRAFASKPSISPVGARIRRLIWRIVALLAARSNVDADETRADACFHSSMVRFIGVMQQCPCHCRCGWILAANSFCALAFLLPSCWSAQSRRPGAMATARFALDAFLDCAEELVMGSRRTLALSTPASARRCRQHGQPRPFLQRHSGCADRRRG